MSGTLVELLKLPLSRAGELKLCSVTGRQVSIRDLNTEKMSFVPLKEPIERITCMTSGWYVDKQLLAVGFTENEAEDVSAFLMWAAEPKMMTRKESGLKAVLLLGLLSVLLYLTNKKLWSKVKGKKLAH